MTHQEYMHNLHVKVYTVFSDAEEQMHDIVKQVWEDGKRNAEVETLSNILEQAIGQYYDVPNNDRDCVLLYKGKKIKCKIGTIYPGFPGEQKRKFEVFEV